MQITSLCRFIYERPNVEVRNMELKAMTILRWQACDGSNYFKVCSSLLKNTQNDEVNKKQKPVEACNKIKRQNFPHDP